MWSCLFFCFGVDVREEQLIRALSFGKDLCQSLFSFLLFLVMQTAVFIVSPIQCTSGLMVRICMSNRLCVRSCCWGHYVQTCAEAWKQVALSHLCWVLGGTCFFAFAVWCMSLTGSGFLEKWMIWSQLWPWCSIKRQSQAAGMWTPLQLGSANNTQKELVKSVCPEKIITPSRVEWDMQAAWVIIVKPLQYFCVCFFPCRREEELLDHLCPWAWQDNII